MWNNMQSCSGLCWYIYRTEKVLYVVGHCVNFPLLIITVHLPFHFLCLMQM